jgi:parallel beta-helix repeat protein
MRRAAVLAIVAGAFVAFGAGPAHANHVSCGDTITADTTLDSDLIDCPDNGIVIGADNITLDLNGHTMDGDNELIDPCPGDDFCDAGVANDGHKGVTIKGGKIREFGSGVFVFGVKHNSLRNLHASRNIFNGITIGNSVRSGVKGSLTSANGLETDFPGIAVFGSKRIRIKRTTSTRNADLGLFVVDSDHNRFVRNKLAANPEAGAIIEGDRNTIGRNQVVRNGDGIILSGNGNTVARNHISKARGNQARHCPGGCGGFAISLEDGHNNVLAGNQIRDSRNTGIRLSTFVGHQHLRDNIVRRNIVRGAGRNGVHVEEGVEGTLLLRNHVSRAGDDGIDVESPATTLTRNHANHNADFGIAAILGVVDGGGNKARGNGNPAQCTHVAC